MTCRFVHGGGRSSRWTSVRCCRCGVLQQAAALGHSLAEDARSTRAFLKRVHAVVPLSLALQLIDIRDLPRPAKGRAAGAAPGDQAWRELLGPMLAGQDLGPTSEAALPAVADLGGAHLALDRQGQRDLGREQQPGHARKQAPGESSHGCEV
jgi:hypothetical protein